MARGEPIRHMERVLLADGEWVGLESTYVAVARVPALDTGFDPGSSFYAHLREELGSLSGTPTSGSRRSWPPRARRC
ncbi:HTH-type transcriptional repressor PhnF [Streptomyces sp. ADI96-15]|nr:HTH-type transcriptional repressor PhnF [Streptomyces sp. ADI96-15]